MFGFQGQGAARIELGAGLHEILLGIKADTHRITRHRNVDTGLNGAVLQITSEGRPYARTIAALFDSYRQDCVRRFSSAV